MKKKVFSKTVMMIYWPQGAILDASQRFCLSCVPVLAFVKFQSGYSLLDLPERDVELVFG